METRAVAHYVWIRSAVQTWLTVRTLVITLFAFGLMAGISFAQAEKLTNVTTRVSVDSTGTQANGESTVPTISANGRFVSFESVATNLVDDDTSVMNDIFVHDRKTGETTRVSVNSEGGEANGGSQVPAMSADGRSVVFISGATNLVAGDTNGFDDIFVHDRRTGVTTRVSVASAGNETDSGSTSPAISANGRIVAFMSPATNLVPDDTNEVDNIFVHDRHTGLTTRVSVNSEGIQANSISDGPTLSANGRFVAFNSAATNLVPNDTNGTFDAFVHDRRTGETTRVNVASDGTEATSFSANNAISGDGRFVAFFTAASLVPEDTNNDFDVFVQDRKTRTTARVNVNSAGGQANGHTIRLPSLTADGRTVAFCSEANNLVPDDTNGALDIFVHERRRGR
jgi:hypothetical protein